MTAARRCWLTDESSLTWLKNSSCARHIIAVCRSPRSIIASDPSGFRLPTIITRPCASARSVEKTAHHRLGIRFSSGMAAGPADAAANTAAPAPRHLAARPPGRTGEESRSEEHTSELQSHSDLVCRLLLEKKNIR